MPFNPWQCVMETQLDRIIQERCIFQIFLKSMQLDVTTQIYIVGGTLAGVLLLVGLMVMILALNITRLTH